MSTTTFVSRRQPARLASLVLFVAVQPTTDLFARYPPLQLVALLGVVGVVIDAVTCVCQRLRVLPSTLEDGDGAPSCR